MSSSFLQSVAVSIVVVLLFTCSIVSSNPDMTFLYKVCNGGTYNSGDPFEYSLDYLLSDLVTVTANHPGYSYYTQSPYPESVAYGHGLCNPALTFTDCVTCISYVKQQLVSECPDRIGAQMKLIDCHMRYEQYPFSD